LKLHRKTKKEINKILTTTGGKMEEVDKVLIEDDVRRKLKLKGKMKKDINKILEEWGGNMEYMNKILNEMDVDSGACDDFKAH
jgi:predicted RNA-binding protein Jag